MVGWLDEIKTNYLKWITNYADGGVVSVNLPEIKGSSAVLEIKKVKTKQRPRVVHGKVEMDLIVKANLNVAEINQSGGHNELDESFLKQLEELAENKIKQQIESTIEYVQHEYGADVFYFGTNIRRFAPAAWDRIKDNWDELFRTFRVNVSVSVRINQIGLLK
jgi:Spore germination B3/ GerAC like, C-terminal.